MASDDYTKMVSGYYSRGDAATRILDALRGAGIDPATATALDLAPFDNLHARGRSATLDLAQRAALAPGSRVLDIGGGVGGPGRTLASEFGCDVTVLDLTEEFCHVGAMLTELTKLSDRVRFLRGNALDAPFPDASFDAVWMQASGMNIPDKARLYAEIRRLLRPGGRYALQEALSGPGGAPHFPVPWTRNLAASFLQPAGHARALLEATGFNVLTWDEIARPSGAQRLSVAQGQSHIFPGVVSGPEIEEATANIARNLAEDRIRVIQAIFERVG